MTKLQKAILVAGLILLVDQVLKIWIKTNMMLGEEYRIFDWFIIHFVENNGMAFGMELAGEYGKMFLSIFRIVAVGGIAWYLYTLAQKDAPLGLIISVSMVMAGALGNIIDCLFYGLIWPEIAMPGAPFPFLFGRVVDMFYFPLFDYKLPWMDHPQTFFGAVFNFADSCVTCGAIYLLLFQYKFFAKEEEKKAAK